MPSGTYQFSDRLFFFGSEEHKGMLLTEYNEAKAMELFKEEGRVEGMDMIITLIKKLLDLSRTDDVTRVTEDPAYRDKLISDTKT